MNLDRRALMGAALLILARTALLVALTPAHAPLTGDEPAYDALARSVLAGHGFTYQNEPWIYKPPGWPGVMAGLYAVFGDDRRVVVAFQGLCDGGTALCSAALASWVFGSGRAAALAFLMALLWPPFFRESRFLQTEPLYTFGVILTLLGFARFTAAPAARTGFLLGLAAGLTALVRPTGFLPLAGAALGWLLLRRGAALRRWPALAAMALGAILVVAPWTVRNARVFHAFVPLSTGGGELFYMGTTPETDGRWIPQQWLTLKWPLIGDEEVRLGRKLDAVERDRLLMRAGIANWKRNPAGSAAIALKRLWRLCFLPLRDPDRPWLRAGFFVSLLALYALAIPAAWRGRRAPDPAGQYAALLGVGLVVAVLAHAMFYTNSRYFEPLRPIVLVLAAGTLAGHNATGSAKRPPSG